MHHQSLSRIHAVEAGPDAGSARGTPSAGRRSTRVDMALAQLADLQSQIARLADLIHDIGDAEGNRAAAADGQPVSASSIRAMLQARVDRASHFPGELFADPAWDMLLDLYAAELDQIRVSVTSLCVASNAATSTALRWISTLERAGLVERRSDPLDGRRIFLSLTPEAVESFRSYFLARDARDII